MFDEAPLFSLFWENSKLNARTSETFAGRLDEDARSAATQPRLFYPDADVPLERPRDPLAALADRRRAGRTFSDAALDERQVGSLFHAFAERNGSRQAASAGGKYPIEVFAFFFRVAGPLAGSAVYYNADAHALSRVGDAPSWETLKDAATWSEESGPAILFVLAAMPSRVTARYGERGGRFVLLEAGAYAHGLALRAAHEDLAGVELGGLHDDTIRRHLGLERTEAAVILGYACGVRGNARPGGP